MKRSLQRFAQRAFGEAGVRVLSVLFIMALARTLGAEEFGRYSSAMAFAALFCILVDLGTNAILTREIARHPDRRSRIVAGSHFLKLAGAAAAVLALLLATYIMGFSTDKRLLVLCLGIVLIGQTWTEYAAALLVGLESMGWEAILKFLMRLASLSGGVLALWMQRPLSDIACWMAISTLLSYFIVWTIIKSQFSTFAARWDKEFLQTLLKSSLPIMGSVVFWLFYDNQDVLILNYFNQPQESIGHFAAAAKIIDVLRVYPALVVGVFFPGLARMAKTNMSDFFKRAMQLGIGLTATLLILIVVVHLGAPWLSVGFYGRDFLPSATYLNYLLPILLGIGLNHLMLNLLIALDEERRLFISAAAACLSNLLFAFILIPQLGTLGACWALVGSEGVFSLFLLHGIWRDRKKFA